MVLRARVIGARSSAKSCLPGPQDGAMLRCHSNMRRSEITSRKSLAIENKKTWIRNFVEIMAKARAQNDHEYEPEIKFCCHAVLIGPSFKKTLAETTVFLRDREFANSRQQLEAIAGLRKAKKCLSRFNRSKRRIPLQFRQYFGNKSQYFSLLLFKDNSMTEQCPITTD